MNEQAPTKRETKDDGRVLVHSMFHTIQGEGPLVGFPSVFIRLAGCNLQCPWCDTEYTQNPLGRLSVESIVSRVVTMFKQNGTLVGSYDKLPRKRPLIVLTGGEPFRQPLWRTVYGLISSGFQVQIETNGTLFQEVPQDIVTALLGNIRFLTIVCSPKTGTINAKLQPMLSALKYVAKAGCIAADDGLPVLALDHPAAPRVARPPLGFAGPVYLQPMDEGDVIGNLKNLDAVVSACKKFGHTLCLQTHKIIGEQ